MKTQAELLELHGQEYVESYGDHSMDRLSRLLPLIEFDNDFDVVDFACGNGMLMDLVAPRVNSYVGVDFSEPFIEAARSRQQRLGISNAEFVCSDLIEFCREHSQQFDAAFAMDLSQHVYDDQWLDILQSIRGSLKPAGTFYMHTPNAEFLLEILKNKNIVLKQLPQHIAPRTPRQCMELLEQAGFCDLQVRLVSHYNVLRLLHPVSYVPVIGRFLKARIFIAAKA